MKTAFRGTEALALTAQVVSFGERPSGSPQIARLQQWIAGQLKPLSCQVTLDSWTAQTPAGPVPMTNIVARFAGSEHGAAVAVTGHYDTKRVAGQHFVGANDGGSSTGLLLELAKRLSAARHAADIYLVWFDGEEAVGEWSATDSLYGSRHLADKWTTDGTIARLKWLINVDMIGDRELDIYNDQASSPGLRKQIWAIASELGYAAHFQTEPNFVEDDHLPFVRLGVNAVDLLDLDYGPNRAYWHTAQDTMDKLSAQSLQVVGDVVLTAIHKLQ